MPNIRRVMAGFAARAFGRLLVGQEPGDITWLARTLYRDRDAGNAVALAHFAKAYYNIIYRNSSGDMAANGEFALLHRLTGLPLTTALDAGANVGEWTAAMKTLFPAVQIHAFEIIPETARRMRENIAGLTGVQLNECGLGAAAAEIEIRFSPANSVLSSAVGDRTAEFPELEGTWQTIRGKVISGDDYVAEHGINHINFLKIDVEGMEKEVLAGFHKTFNRGAVDIVQFEYSPLNKFIPLLLREFYEFFETRGFVVGKVYPKGVAFKSYETQDEDFVGLTYIACRGDQKELINRIGYRLDR